MSGARSVVVALVAGLAGGAAVSFALNPPARDATAPPVSASDAELLAELRRVREEIVRLGARLAPAGASMPAGLAATAAPGRASDDRLAAAMDRLAAALEARAAASGSRAPSISADVASVNRPTDEIVSLAEKAAKGGSGAVKSFWFWSYQKVLDRFGTPDWMYAQEGYVWFVYGASNEQGRAVQLRFQFFDGFVSAVMGQ